MKLYVRNVSYFIVDQYQKSTCFYAEDAYYYYDVDVDRILLHKESENEYFIIDGYCTITIKNNFFLL